MSQNIKRFLDLDLNNFFKDVPRKPLSFWGSVKEGMKVPFVEPSLFNAIAFEQDPSVNTAELLLNTSDIISAGDPNFIRYSWQDVVSNLYEINPSEVQTMANVPIARFTSR